MPAPAPASTIAFSQLIALPAQRTKAKFAKLRGKVRQVRAANVFFGKIAHFEYLSSLEKGEVKMNKQQRKDFESGKLAEETLSAAQEVWLLDKNLTGEVVRMAKDERLFGRLVASASATLMVAMGIGTAIAVGTFVAPIPILTGVAAVFFIAVLYPWRGVGIKVRKTLGTLAAANSRAQEDVG